jgi:hypothetical protein
MNLKDAVKIEALSTMATACLGAAVSGGKGEGAS